MTTKRMTKSEPRAGGGRKAPERTCCVCRAKGPKRDLVRVMLAAGQVEIDPTGKGPGRGAYLCRRLECWQSRQRDRRIGQALRGALDADDRLRLEAWAAQNLADTGNPLPIDTDERAKRSE